MRQPSVASSFVRPEWKHHGPEQRIAEFQRGVEVRIRDEASRQTTVFVRRVEVHVHDDVRHGHRAQALNGRQLARATKSGRQVGNAGVLEQNGRNGYNC